MKPPKTTVEGEKRTKDKHMILYPFMNIWNSSLFKNMKFQIKGKEQMEEEKAFMDKDAATMDVGIHEFVQWERCKNGNSWP